MTWHRLAVVLVLALSALLLPACTGTGYQACWYRCDDGQRGCNALLESEEECRELASRTCGGQVSQLDFDSGCSECGSSCQPSWYALPDAAVAPDARADGRPPGG